MATKHRLGICGPPRLTHILLKKGTKNKKLASCFLLNSLFQPQNRLVAKCQQITDKYRCALEPEKIDLLVIPFNHIDRRSHAHTYLLFLLHTPVAANSITLVLRSSFGPSNSELRLFAVM